MENVNAHMAIYDSFEKVEGAGWNAFFQGFAAAIARDMQAVREEVLEDAAQQAPPAPHLHKCVLRKWLVTKLGAHKSSLGSVDPRLGMRNGGVNMHKFMEYADHGVSVLMGALDKIDGAAEPATIQQAMQNEDSDVDSDKASTVELGNLLQDVLASLTKGEARVADDDQADHEMGGLISWWRLRTRFWSMSEQSAADISDQNDTFPRQKKNMIRELPRQRRHHPVDQGMGTH